MRGRVMGFVQTAFAASQVLGLPVGLYLANLWNWHAPFVAIVAIALPAGIVIAIYMRPVTAHLALKQEHSPRGHFIATLRHPNYTMAFAVTAILATGGFMLMPFSSAFLVNNVGIDLAHIPTIYLVTGLATVFAGPLIGRAADRFGKYQTFLFWQRGFNHNGGDLDKYGSHPALACGYRQCVSVRGHILAHHPFPSAALAIPEISTAGAYLTRSARPFSNSQGHCFTGSGMADRAGPERSSAPFRLAGRNRNRRHAAVAGADVPHPQGGAGAARAFAAIEAGVSTVIRQRPIEARLGMTRPPTD